MSSYVAMQHLLNLVHLEANVKRCGEDIALQQTILKRAEKVILKKRLQS
jgi:hypothetical protein